MSRPRKIGLKDIAAEAGVSISAVSMALADHPRIGLDTRERVRQISERLGYSQGRRYTPHDGAAAARIGFVSIDDDLRRPLVDSLVMHITSLASQRALGVEVAAWCHDQNHNQMVGQLLRSPHRPDGLLVSGKTDEAFFRAVAAAGLPCVALGDPLVDLPVDAVNFDHAAAARRAASYLIAKGHRRIGFIADTLIPRGSGSRSLDGLRLALVDAGLPVDPRLVHATGAVNGGMATVPESLLRGNGAPTAYLVPNHYLGEAVIATLRGLGRDATVCLIRIKEMHDGASCPAPCIVYSLRTFCLIAMERLLHLCGNPHQSPHLIIAPHETLNMV